MPVKCKKCGADIPDTAVFCPGCGAAKPQEKQKPQPAPISTPPQPVVTPPPQTKPPKPQKTGPSGMQGFIDFAFSIKMMVLGLFIAILIAWIARIVNQFVGGIVNNVMNILNFTFMTGAGVLLLFGGLLNSKMDKLLRVGFIIAGALIIAWNL